MWLFSAVRLNIVIEEKLHHLHWFGFCKEYVWCFFLEWFSTAHFEQGFRSTVNTTVSNATSHTNEKEYTSVELIQSSTPIEDAHGHPHWGESSQMCRMWRFIWWGWAPGTAHAHSQWGKATQMDTMRLSMFMGNHSKKAHQNTHNCKPYYTLAPSGALIAIPTYYWSTTTHFFSNTPVLNTGLSEPQQLYHMQSLDSSAGYMYTL